MSDPKQYWNFSNSSCVDTSQPTTMQSIMSFDMSKFKTVYRKIGNARQNKKIFKNSCLAKYEGRYIVSYQEIK